MHACFAKVVTNNSRYLGLVISKQKYTHHTYSVFGVLDISVMVNNEAVYFGKWACIRVEYKSAI